MHFDAVLRQHANGSAIQFSEGHAGHASNEKRHPAAPLAFRRKHASQVGERKLAVNPRRQRIQFRHPQKLENSRRARQRLQPRSLIEAHEPRVARQATERWQNFGIEMLAQPRRQPRTLVVFRDLRTRPLQQAAVGDARRARGLAVQATKAAVDVRHERIAQRQPAFVHLHDLVDAPARRIHLRAQRAVRRALIETQPAVHATRVQIPRRLLVRREVRVARLDCSGCGAQKISLPRKMLFGSSACFTARMLAKLGGSPHHGLARLATVRPPMSESRARRNSPNLS